MGELADDVILSDPEVQRSEIPWRNDKAYQDQQPSSHGCRSRHREHLPVGPLNDEPHTVRFGVCDTDCLKWLDELDISFGSFAAMTGDQMEEIVRGLEASSKKFLWVIRLEQPEISKVRFPSTDQGMVVPWSPQRKVAVGAFLSHCGWNSTVEAVARPLLATAVRADKKSIMHKINKENTI
ncbi:indole-3-acetate beta-glucosyltransferase [Selaginella moellendorffii]|uniref:indole-3-acetate beta-glucosyltransferase n=1 Tax=Selaginella moellendorffii TaxID=88036 RepID=UPI000D1CF238|nr:indole-3-acetate beta-glucosyltransferase [Selaginella moellendorffii]|eukprot:XP_024540702.1 indole-3-acetate beta-glucosyltransferase [Selaginella moellendorffii]